MGLNSACNIFAPENPNIRSWKSEKRVLAERVCSCEIKNEETLVRNGMKLKKKELGKKSCFISKKECREREKWEQ